MEKIVTNKYFVKTKKVIESCQNLSQLEIAEKYANMTIELMLKNYRKRKGIKYYCDYSEELNKHLKYIYRNKKNQLKGE